MAVVLASGTVTTTASEQTITNPTSGATYGFNIYLDAIQTGDAIVIKVYRWDNVSSTYKIYKQDPIVGPAPTEVDWNYAPLAAYKYKVTIQRTAGTDRAYNWVLASY